MHEKVKINTVIGYCQYHHIVTRTDAFFWRWIFCIYLLTFGLLKTVSAAQFVQRRAIRCLTESRTFWDVTFCRWVISSRLFDRRNNGQGVQDSSWTAELLDSRRRRHHVLSSNTVSLPARPESSVTPLRLWRKDMVISEWLRSDSSRCGRNKSWPDERQEYYSDTLLEGITTTK